MAGTIIISEESAWPVGTVAFLTVAELTREAFPREHREDLEMIYSPMEGALDILVLDELDTEGFNRFYRATRQQYSRCLQSHSCEGLPDDFYDGVMTCWKELLSLLEGDPRFVPEAATKGE